MAKNSKYGHLTETEYLYGVKVIWFLYLPYKWAVKYKLKKCRELMRTLYMIEKKDFDDEVRLHKVFKAIKHNEKLIREWE